MRRLGSLLNIAVPLYFVFSLLVLGVGAALFLLFAMIYAERGSGIPVLSSVGTAVRSVGIGAYDLVYAVYRTTGTLDGDTHADLIAPVNFELDGGLRPVQASGVDVGDIEVRHAASATPGWRIMLGMFNVNGERVHAALALDSAMTVRHVWPVHEDGVAAEVEDEFFKFPHGFEILRDGSVVFSFDHGKSLRRFDACGHEIWTLLGVYHHSVTYDQANDSLWTLRAGPALAPNTDYEGEYHEHVVEIAVQDGQILREFDLQEVMEANPHLDVFGIRQRDDHHLDEPNWAEDPFHINDADPLPPAMVGAFPGFEANDVMLSLRSLNLIVAVDPETRAIRWHRSGFVRRQHDPDWLADGRVLVYDNNMNFDTSRIVAIDPSTFEVETVLDGARYDFYSGIRGKQQLLPDGSLLVTSSMQGRVFEVAPDGEIVFELVNFLDENKTEVVVISEARWVPEDWFEFDAFPTCNGPVTARAAPS